MLRDDNNRVLIYSIKDGELRHRFFGSNAAMNPRLNQVIVENYPGELTVYDLATGNTQARLRFNSGAAFVRFSLDGKKLFVLTAGRTAYAFNVDKLATKNRLGQLQEHVPQRSTKGTKISGTPIVLCAFLWLMG